MIVLFRVRGSLSRPIAAHQGDRGLTDNLPSTEGIYTGRHYEILINTSNYGEKGWLIIEADSDDAARRRSRCSDAVLRVSRVTTKTPRCREWNCFRRSYFILMSPGIGRKPKKNGKSQFSSFSYRNMLFPMFLQSLKAIFYNSVTSCILNYHNLSSHYRQPMSLSISHHVHFRRSIRGRKLEQSFWQFTRRSLSSQIITAIGCNWWERKGGRKGDAVR